MSRPTRNKSDAPKKSGSSLLTGILLGMVFGVALAAGLAWYLLKSPSPFVNKEQAVRPAAEAEKPAEAAKPAVAAAPAQPEAPAAQPAPTEDAKPRFEFYKVLTDKPDVKASSAAASPKPAENKAAAPFSATSLQVGAFAAAGSAESLKAKLAMNGMEAGIVTTKDATGAEWHVVRVGPFRTEKELSDARATLKQMGVEPTRIR